MTSLATQHRSRRRRLKNIVVCSLLGASVLVALAPLIGVLSFVISKGAKQLTPSFLTHSMRGVGPLDATGGIYHAIIGTLEQVGIAILLAVPLGLVVAVYLVEYKRTLLSSAVRFVVDVMTGIPSIVAGLFIFAFWVIGLHQGFSGLAAGMALAILMLPIVVRSAEEMLKLVPNDLREASYALGISRGRTVTHVVFPTAASGISTGIVLAIARVTGETAPLLLTAFGFDSIRTSPVEGPQSSLPLFVFSQAGSAFDVAIQRAWGGAVALILMVLLLTTIARVLTNRNRTLTF